MGTFMPIQQWYFFCLLLHFLGCFVLGLSIFVTLVQPLKLLIFFMSAMTMHLGPLVHLVLDVDIVHLVSHFVLTDFVELLEGCFHT